MSEHKHKHQLGDAPIEPQYVKNMQAIAQVLDETFNGDLKGDDRTAGFVLLVFPFGPHDGRCNFISNGADRSDVAALMKEMIRRFEGQPEMKGRA